MNNKITLRVQNNNIPILIKLLLTKIIKITKIRMQIIIKMNMLSERYKDIINEPNYIESPGQE